MSSPSIIPLSFPRTTTVTMQLRIGEAIFPMAQLGPDFVILKCAAAHPPGDGEILLRIDDNEERIPVHLPAGLNATTREARIAPI